MERAVSERRSERTASPPVFSRERREAAAARDAKQERLHECLGRPDERGETPEERFEPTEERVEPTDKRVERLSVRVETREEARAPLRCFRQRLDKQTQRL